MQVLTNLLIFHTFNFSPQCKNSYIPSVGDTL